ncbi:MAG: helicase-related protein, partial [Candidatus Latescibacterota bacterium]|nr:helicase-related protein [Candidatus Latescibacterota bacterium]
MSEKKPPTSLIAQLNALLPQCMQNDALHITRKMRQKRRLPSGQLERLVKRARSSSELLKKRRAHVPEPRYPSSLPIAGRRTEILQAICDNPVVIIAGETGSGKTTQLPKMCLEAGCGVRGKIAVTQPRRVAALSIARRIAEELELEYGRHIGSKIRFRDQTSPETFIKVMTDGMLLAETQGDRDLSEYDAIVVDEAHERSLNIDFLIGYLRLLRQRRPELKIIITSATIDTETFSNAFDGAPIIEVSGRVYPVEVHYKPLDEGQQDSGECTYIDAAADAVDELLKASRQGDILVFMPSERDIRETRDKIERRRYSQTEILPLFGRLSAADQQRVFAQQDQRRVVIATNIAETSLTIPNIRYVVDTGLARVSRYNPRTHTQRLPIEAIAQSSAEQRKGRCGRVADGTCIRLYEERDFLARPEFAQPEIQ